MTTQCKFDFVKSKDVEMRFDEGPISSDAGLVVMIQWLHQTKALDRYVDILDKQDPRDPNRTQHTTEELVRQRVLQIMAGYEDANDCDRLANEPIFRAANGHIDDSDPTNASQPTMSRLENRVDARDVVRLNHELLEGYIDARRANPPDELILDIDATPAAAHGAQQQALFDGHHSQRMYFPLVMCDGKTGELLAVRLRSGRAHDKHRAKPMVRRVISRLTEAFPTVSLKLRADDGFTDARLYRLLDGFDVEWTINYAANEVLHDRTDETRAEVRTEYEQTDRKGTQYELLDGYQAYSWDTPRWVAAKIEYGPQGANRRFVVCSEKPESARSAFEFYEGRGVCEQYIRELKNGYRGDKLSCHRFVANAFRLVVYGIAYTLVARFRQQHLDRTELAGSWIQTMIKSEILCKSALL